MTELPGFFLSLSFLFPSSVLGRTGREQIFLRDFSFFGLQTASECPDR